MPHQQQPQPQQQQQPPAWLHNLLLIIVSVVTTCLVFLLAGWRPLARPFRYNSTSSTAARLSTLRRVPAAGASRTTSANRPPLVWSPVGTLQRGSTMHDFVAVPLHAAPHPTQPNRYLYMCSWTDGRRNTTRLHLAAEAHNQGEDDHNTSLLHDGMRWMHHGTRVQLLGETWRVALEYAWRA